MSSTAAWHATTRTRNLNGAATSGCATALRCGGRSVASSKCGSRRTTGALVATSQKPRTDGESLACLAERSGRPKTSPARLPADEEDRICELRRRTGWSPRRLADEVGRPHSTVHQVLRRGGCSRPAPSERPPVIRYEWPC